MTFFNRHTELYAPRLIENLREIPFSIYDHLLGPESILWAKQKEAIEHAALKLFNEQKRAVALIMPTGTGKMVMISQILAGLKQDVSNGLRPKRALIVTDRAEGVLQAEEKLNLYAGIEPGLFYYYTKDASKDVIVATYHSWQKPDFPVNPEDIDILILDEGHCSLSPARRAALQKYKNALWIATTASPTYSEKRDLLHYYDVAFEMTVVEAINHSMISSCHNILLNTDIDLDLAELGRSGDDYNERLLARAINIKARNKIGADYILFGEHPDTGQPIREIPGIISCAGVDHAREVAHDINLMYANYYPEKMPEHGFIRAVSGSMTERSDILKWHKEGKIGYLAYADLLHQNYDDKRIGVCLNLRLTQSKVVARQRGGRTLRIDENNPGKIALIVDVLDKYKGKLVHNPLFYAQSIADSPENIRFTIITEQAATIAAAEKFKRNKLSQQKSEAIPEDIKALIKDIELRMVVEEDRLVSIIKDKEVDFGSLRKKTEDDLLVDDFVRKGFIKNAVNRQFDKLENEWKLHKLDPETYVQPDVSMIWVRNKQGIAIRAIPRSDEKKFIETYQLKKGPHLRIKTDEDLTPYDFAKKGYAEGHVRNLFIAIEKEWEKHNADPHNIPRPHVVVEKIGRSTVTRVISKKDEEIFINTYKPFRIASLESKGDLYLSAEDFIQKGFTGTAYVAFKKLKREWEAHRKDPENIATPPLMITQVLGSKGNIVWVIRRSDEETFINTYKIKTREDIRDKTIDDISVSDLAKEGFRKSTIENHFRKFEREWQAYNEDPDKKEKPLIPLENVRNIGGLSVRTIPAQYKDFFIEHYKPQKLGEYPNKTENNLSTTDFKNMGYQRESVSKQFAKLEEAWQLYKSDNENNPKPGISIVKVRNHQGSIILTIPSTDLETFLQDCKPALSNDNLKQKTDQHISTKDLIRMGYTHVSTYRAFRTLEKEWDDHKDNPQAYPEPSIPLELVRPVKGVPMFTISSKDLENFISRYNIKIDKNLDRKTDQDLALKEFVQKGYMLKSVKDAFVSLEKSWDKHEQDPDANPRPRIPLKWVMPTQGAAVRSISATDELAFIEDYKLKKSLELREKTEQDITINELAEMGFSRSGVRRGFDTLQKEWEAYEKDSQQPKPSILLEEVKPDTPGASVRVIPKISMQSFVDAHQVKLEEKLRKKTDQDISIYDLSEEGFSLKQADDAFKSLKNAWNAYNDDPGHNPRPDIPIERIRSRTGPIVHVIPEDCKDKLISYFKLQIYREKTDDDLSASDLAKKGYSKAQIQNTWSQLKTEWDNYEAAPEKNSKPSIPLEKVRIPGIGGMPTLVIPQSAEGTLISLYKLTKINDLRTKTNQDMSAEDFAAEGFPISAVRQIFNSIKKEMEAHENDPESNPAPLFRVEEVRGKHNTVTLVAVLNDKKEFTSHFQMEKSDKTKKSHIFSTHYNLKKVEEADSNKYLSIHTFKEKGYTTGSIRLSFSRLVKEWKKYWEDPEKNVIPKIPLEKAKGSATRYLSVIPKEYEEAFILHYKPTLDKNLRDKTDQDMTVEDFFNKGFLISSVRLAFKKLNKAWEAYQIDSEKNPKPSIMIEKIKGGIHTYAISKNDEAIFLYQFQIHKLREKTEQDLAIRDFVERGYPESSVNKAFKKIEKEWAAYEKDSQNIAKPPILIETVRGNHGAPIFTLPQAYESEFYARYNVKKLRDKTSQDIVTEDLINKGFTRNSVWNAFNQASNEWKEYKKNPDNNNQPPFPLSDVKGKTGHPVLAFPAESEDAFVKHYKLVKTEGLKTDKNLSVNDFVNKGYAKATIEKIFKQLEKAQEQRNLKEQYRFPLQIHRLESGSIARTLPQEFEDDFIGYYKLQKLSPKTDQELSAEDLTKNGLSISVLTAAFRKLEQDWENHRESPEQKEPPLIPLLYTKNARGLALRTIPIDSEEAFLSTYLSSEMYQVYLENKTDCTASQQNQTDDHETDNNLKKGPTNPS